MSRTVSDRGPDSRSTSGFVGNGDLLPLERCAFGLGHVVRQAVLEVGGPALGPGAAGVLALDGVPGRADLHRVGTARVEVAAGRRFDQVQRAPSM